MASYWTEGEPHDCCMTVEREEKIRPDLLTHIIPQGVMVFSDGCCFRDSSGTLRSGIGIAALPEEDIEILIEEPLQGHQSVQRAEIVAMTKALVWGEGKIVYLFSDSTYAVGAVVTELPKWKRCGFMAANNKPIKHQEDIIALATAIMKPKQVAIIKCKGHDTSN